MVRTTPRDSQRRPEVTTRSRRHSGGRDALQRLAQRDVLHQRERGEAAARRERRARHEDRLVAGRDAGEPRARVHEPARPAASSGCRPSIAHVEAAPVAAPAAARPSSTRRAAPGGQARVGVQEEQHVAARRARAGVHLAARPRGAIEHAVGERRGELARAVAAAAVDDDHLVRPPRAAAAARRARRRCRRLRRGRG